VLFFFLFQLITVRSIFGDGTYNRKKLECPRKEKGRDSEGAFCFKMKTASLRVFEAWFSPEI